MFYRQRALLVLCLKKLIILIGGRLQLNEMLILYHCPPVVFEDPRYRWKITKIGRWFVLFLITLFKASSPGISLALSMVASTNLDL